MEDKKKYYDLKEAAELSGYSESHLRELCVKKKVAHERRGIRYFFTMDQIDALFTKVEPENKK